VEAGAGRRTIVILAHAFVGWLLCAATIGIGFKLTTLQNALIVHAIAAPIYFFTITRVYYRWFGYTTPVQTAIAFTGFIVAMDFFVTALIINRSLAMFASALGTWIPFGLILASTWLGGVLATRRKSTLSPA
jgi:hypothetical protein